MYRIGTALACAQSTLSHTPLQFTSCSSASFRPSGSVGWQSARSRNLSCTSSRWAPDPMVSPTPAIDFRRYAAASVLLPHRSACARVFPWWVTSWGRSGVQRRSLFWPALLLQTLVEQTRDQSYAVGRAHGNHRGRGYVAGTCTSNTAANWKLEKGCAAAASLVPTTSLEGAVPNV